MNHHPRSSRQPARQPWSREELLRRRAIALGASLESSTLSTYQSGLNSYLTFCNIHSLPHTPTPDTLSFFVVYMSHHISPKSVKNYLTGLSRCLEAFYPDVAVARESRLVRNTMAGCLKLRSRPTSRKPPLLASHLRVIRTLPASYDDRLFFAIIFCGHFGLHRLGELVYPDARQHQNHRKLIKRFSVARIPAGFSYTLPFHKSDRYYLGNTVVIAARNDDIDPVRRLEAYLDLRDSRFATRCELFIKADGSVPTRSWFLARLQDQFPSEGLAGHSLRAGGATELALGGTSDNIIRRIGRWSSEAWERYVRVHPVILAALLQHQ